MRFRVRTGVRSIEAKSALLRVPCRARCVLLLMRVLERQLCRLLNVSYHKCVFEARETGRATVVAQRQARRRSEGVWGQPLSA